MNYLEFIDKQSKTFDEDHPFEHHVWLRSYSDEVVYLKSWDDHVLAHKLLCELPSDMCEATDIQRSDAFHYVTINPKYSVSDEMKSLALCYMSNCKKGKDQFTKESRLQGVITRKLRGSYVGAANHLQTKDNYTKIANTRKITGSYTSLNYNKICTNCGNKCTGGSSKRKCPKCGFLTLKGE